MQRSTALTRAAMQQRRRRSADPLPAVLRAAVFVRSAGLCDLCGRPLPRVWHCHHRKLRSQGGRHEAENLLALHDACHRRVHARPAWARRCGYIVARNVDPSARPVWRHRARWQLPNPGGWAAAEPPPATEEAA
jgi:hypothetical protein